MKIMNKMECIFGLFVATVSDLFIFIKPKAQKVHTPLLWPLQIYKYMLL